ncbi:MAG: hypothetical protein M0015_10840 [Betaproteobacteria bacterium]|nr:hypothetical protein [Betaproteobacteria bacterium]
MEPEQSIAPPSPALSELRTVPEAQSELTNIFPTLGALEWELKVRRREYIEAGAFFWVAGRILLHPARFAETALKIGTREAARRAARTSQPA